MECAQNDDKRKPKKLTKSKIKNIQTFNISSLKTFSHRNSGNILKSMNKETLDKTYINSLTNINNTESLPFSKNNSTSPTLDSKAILYPQETQNQSIHKIEKTEKKNKSEDKIITEERTKKIDYRFYRYYPIKNAISSFDNNQIEIFIWFAAYDKLIKKEKLMKIFSFYNITPRACMILGNELFYNNYYKIKEKKIIIQNYEIYFVEKYNKPFIRKSKGKNIFTKLYLLNLKQLNMIFSYLNRIEYKKYIDNFDNILDEGSSKKIFVNNDIKYSSIYCLGSYMNINIYCFSRIENIEEIHHNYSIGVDNYPNSKKISKLIKILIINFPEYSKEYFINYIFSDSYSNPLNFKILTNKKNEISNLLLSNKKALYKQNKKISSNSILVSHISGSPEFSFIANNNLSTIIKNINNNNLGTISNNASNFDFTSEFLSSLRQNEETISKAIDSLRSLSKQCTNKNAKNNHTIYNNFISNKNIKIDESQISNFSFENESKKSQKYLSHKNLSNINVNKKVYNNKIKNKYIRKETIKNIDNYNLKRDSIIPKQFRKKEKSKKINYIKNTILNDLILNNENIDKNSIHQINKTFYEENKENYNSNKTLNFCNYKNYVKSDCSSDNFNKDLSEFTIAKVSKYINHKKNINKRNSFARNNTKDKSSIKGEDIFINNNIEKLNTISNSNSQNIFKSLDYNILRSNQCFKKNQKSDNNRKAIKQRKSYVKRI
jgi:hypothetical protein